MTRRRHTADGKAGGFSNLLSGGAFCLAGQAEGCWQCLLVATAVASDQGHDRLAANREDERLDDGTEWAADAVGRLLGRAGGFGERNDTRRRAGRPEGGLYPLYGRIGEGHG